MSKRFARWAQCLYRVSLMAIDWAGTRVLFTGAQGFIGSWVAERLLDEDAELFVLDRPTVALSRFRMRGLHDRCTPVPAELGDAASLCRTLDQHGIEAVFHLAAATIVGSAIKSPLSTYEVNVRGTWNLLEACRTARAPLQRVVVASTDKAYGIHENLPYREDHALQPHYPYDVSKACADLIARSYAHTFGLPVAVTRFGNVFGGGDFNFSRLIPGTMKALLAGERPVIRSGGLMERDFLYAEDAVSAYLAVAESLDRPELHGRAWNASIGLPGDGARDRQPARRDRRRGSRARRPRGGHPTRRAHEPVARFERDHRAARVDAGVGSRSEAWRRPTGGMSRSCRGSRRSPSAAG